MKSLFLILILSFPLLVKAQLVLNNSKEAMDYAILHNRDIQMAGKKVEMDERQNASVKSAFLPQVKAVSNFDYNFALPVQLIPAEFLGGQPGEFRAIQFGTNFNWTAGVEASMPLFSPSLYAESKVTKYNSQASQASKENAELLVRKEASRGYFITLLSSSSLRITEENFKIADSLKRIAEHKFSNGLMEPIEYNRIVNSWNKANNDYEKSKIILLNNTNALKFHLGLNQKDSLVLSGKLEKIDQEIRLSSDINYYPSIKEKQLLKESSLWSWRKEKLKRLPEISLYGRFLLNAQRNEFNFFNSNYPWYNIGVAGIRMEIPLFTGFGRVYSIERMKYRYEIQKLEEDKERERSILEDQELVSNYKNSIIAAKNLEQSFHLSEQNLKIAMYKYLQGVFSLDQYLNVFNESLQIQSQYLNSLAELYNYQSIIELKNSL